MLILPQTLRYALRANDINRRAANRLDKPEPDPVPVVKFFNPLGSQTWLATELDGDGDICFGLADLGFGTPELGSWRLSELAAIHLPYGLSIEIDAQFESVIPISVWAAWSQRIGSILQAEILFRRLPHGPPLRP